MPARFLLLALLLGAAGGALAAWAVGAFDAPSATDEGPALRTAGEPSVPSPAVARDPGPMLLGSSHAATANTAWREALEKRLVRIELGLREMARQVAAADDDAERIDLDSLGDGELTARASSLYAFKNYAGAVEAYEALLDRGPDLAPGKRAEILAMIAQCHRALGNPKEADEIFQQVEALHGHGTAGAMTARYHRAWLRHAKNDLAGARELMLQVARSDQSPRFWKLFSRANAADFAIRLGDGAQVRRDLEEYRGELEGDTTATGRRVLTYVNRLLESLDA